MADVNIVSINDLSTWLSNQPDNTANTPYEITITGLTTSNYNDIATALTSNSTKYVDLSTTSIPFGVTDMRETFSFCTSLVNAPVIPDSVTNMYTTFYGCTSLVNAPVIPDSVTNMEGTFIDSTSLVNAPVIPYGVTNMEGTFDGCTSLVKAPVIPDGVTDMSGTFARCTSLSHKPIIPSSVTSSTDCYYGVTTSNWKGTRIQIIAFLTTFFAQTVDSELQVYEEDRETYWFSYINCDISTTSTYLFSLPYNTISSAYKIKVRGQIDSTNLMQLNTSAPYRYFDFSLTEIPTGITLLGTDIWASNLCIVKSPILPNDWTDLTEMFSGCGNLQEAPVIPSSATNLEGTFKGCSSLTIAPAIPEGVTNILQAFENCASLVRVPSIPSTVTSGQIAFRFCSNLKTIDVFKIPLATLKGYNFMNMFEGCSSLERIGFKIDESDNWHVFSLTIGGSTVEGTVYGVNENSQITTATITQTSITKSSIRLPVLTDELWFPSGLQASEIEDVIEDMLNYKYGVFNKQVIPPNDKQMVIWADEDENHNAKVVTNIASGIEVETVSASKTITPTKDKRVIVDTASITVTLAFGVTNGITTEVFAMQACTVTYYTAQDTTASLSMASGSKAVFIYYSGWKLHSNYGTTNLVTVDNMQSVSSNAVYNAINSQKIMVKDTKIGNFTLNSGQTVSPNISSYVHTPPQGYGRLCSLYSLGQNFFQLSMNFVGNIAYATITNTYTGTLTTDIYLYEIFMPNNILPT